MAGEGIGVTQRVADVTISKWEKKVSEQTVRRYVLLSMLKSKGLIKTGQSGGELRWVVRVKDHDLDGHIDGAPKQFQRVRTTRNAVLPWRGYEVSDAVTLMEKLQNDGEPAMIRAFADLLETMRKGATRGLATKWFVDGNATGNEQDFHGIESMMSWTTQTAADKFATTTNDTYAGISTSATTFTSDTTDEAYKLWTPVIVNTNRDPDGSGTRAWADYADEYVRAGLLEASRGSAKEENVDLILLTKASYEALLNVLDDKERLVFNRGTETSVAKFGFTNFVEIDGCSIGWDAGVPATDVNSDVVHGYGFNTDRMCLKILGKGKKKNLWSAKLTYNDDYAADRYYMWCLGNLKFECPRHFIKFADISG